MRFATRSTLILVGTAVTIVGGYLALSRLQLQLQLRTGITRETETLARALHAALDPSLRGGHLEAPGELLEAALAGEERLAAMVFDTTGAVMAGDSADLACLRSYLPATALRAGNGRGWADCDPAAYWVALPLPPPAAALVVVQHGVLLERLLGPLVQRKALPWLGLLVVIMLVLPLLLQRIVMTPLGEIMGAVRVLGNEGRMPHIRLRKSAGELAELAAALNQMAEQLGEKRRELIDQSEETLRLEKRLRESEKFAVIGRLSGGLAHELGSPLSVISIRAQVIRAAPGSTPEIRQHAGIIHAQVRRLTDFMQGLLHIAQQQGVVFDPLDLSEVLQEILDEFAPQAAGEEVELEADLPEQPVVVRGQKTLLRHALRNLVRNSFQALYDHEGQRRIHLRLVRKEHEVRVLVEDTGPGIPPRELEKVLEPFYTTKGVGQGMGLGLPITRGIIEEHGGELHLEDIEDAGLRAVVILPANRPELTGSFDPPSGDGRMSAATLAAPRFAMTNRSGPIEESRRGAMRDD